MGYSMTNQLSTMGLEEKYNTYKLSDGSTIGCTIFDTNGTEVLMKSKNIIFLN